MILNGKWYCSVDFSFYNIFCNRHGRRVIVASPLLMPPFSSVCCSGAWVKGSKQSMGSFDFWLAAILVLVWQISVVHLIMAASAQGPVECAKLEFTRHLPVCIHSLHSFYTTALLFSYKTRQHIGLTHNLWSPSHFWLSAWHKEEVPTPPSYLWEFYYLIIIPALLHPCGN